jgi:hypothetical protein
MDQSYSASAVCRAIGMPRGTLNAWAFEGILRNLDSPYTEPRVARRFSEYDALQLAITNQLRSPPLGVAPLSGLAWSNFGVRAFRDGAARYLLFCIDADGGGHVSLATTKRDLCAGLTLPDNPPITLTIDMKTIFDAMMDRLAKDGD